jgi:hypothetical protein
MKGRAKKFQRRNVLRNKKNHGRAREVPDPNNPNYRAHIMF